MKVETGADFSDDRVYRFRLWRKWADGDFVLFVMLNPSTADETKNDPTVERCERRAREMGYAGLVVVNLFALRATDPKELKKHDEPIGWRNDWAIQSEAAKAGQVICGWGAHGDYLDRGAKVKLFLSRYITLYCLGQNRNGSPKHPLYISYEKLPEIYK